MKDEEVFLLEIVFFFVVFLFESDVDMVVDFVVEDIVDEKEFVEVEKISFFIFECDVFLFC